MENCLVTKLKGVVNNPNLPKLGILPISVYAEESPSQASRSIRIEVKDTSAGSTLKAVGGYFASSYSGTYNLTEVSTDNTHVAVVFSENKDFEVEVSNKYDIKTIGYGLGTGFKLSDIGFYANSIETLSTTQEGNANVIGNIADLGICTKLTLFRNVYSSGLYGKLEEFIEKQIANGRTSGQLALRIGGNPNVTFKGTYTMQPSVIYYFVFATSGKLCTVGTGNLSSTEMSEEIGSYDGSTWTWLI